MLSRAKTFNLATRSQYSLFAVLHNRVSAKHDKIAIRTSGFKFYAMKGI
jgi:hypothetical protein